MADNPVLPILKHNKTFGGRPTRFSTLVELSKIETDECILWPFAKDKDGYGKARIGRKQMSAHRAMYFLVHGDPKDLLTRHSCDNPACVNPRHLSLGTDADNVRDCKDRGRRAMGEHMPHAKLTPEIVREIRTYSMTIKDWMQRLGASETVISNARSRRTWKHVK